MLTTRPVTGLAHLAVAGLVVAGACGCAQPDDAASGPRLVARVGQAHVTVVEVQDHLPVTEVGGAVTVYPDRNEAWRSAARLAVRDELLTAYAVRAGLAGGSAPRAERLQAVVARVSAQHPDAKADFYTEAAARAWFAGQSARFEQVEQAHVSWARFTDLRRAEAALPELAASGADYAALARRLGATSSGASVMSAGGAGVDLSVARVVYALKQPSRLGLVAGPEGSKEWWVARIDRARLAAPGWSTRQAQVVRAAMAWERLQAHLSAQADTMSRQVSVSWMPGWDSPPSGGTPWSGS